MTRFLLLLLVANVSARYLGCYFNYHDTTVLGPIYTCLASNLESIKTRGVVIGTFGGNLSQSLNATSVRKFFAKGLTISYLPQGLAAIFPNLEAIHLEAVYLQEIHRVDLQPFPMLRSLDLQDNSIEVLERDLFRYNPKLEVVRLYENHNLKEVHPKVFDNLRSLKHLDFDRTGCVNVEGKSRAEVLALVPEIVRKCNTWSDLEWDVWEARFNSQDMLVHVVADIRRLQAEVKALAPNGADKFDFVPSAMVAAFCYREIFRRLNE